MSCAIVIPARYESSRFPGKPLVNISGKSLIYRVWERCTLATDKSDIFVATDDKRIVEHCSQFGIQTLMTSSSCLTGTDRIYEASLQLPHDRFINVQGDEPLVTKADIDAVRTASEKNSGTVVCGMTEIFEEQDFRSGTVPKVVCDLNKRLLYMSRAAIPTNKTLGFTKAYKQVCVYAFPKALLKEFASVKQKTPIEQIEDIEILRFLEMGHPVQMVELNSPAIAVDTPDDVRRVEAYLRDNKIA